MAILFKVYNLTFGDDFTGENGSLPDSRRWEIVDGSGGNDIARIQGNRLRHDISGNSTAVDAKNLYTFDGEFDIQVDWWKITGPSTNNWHGSIRAYITDGLDAGQWAGIGRLFSVAQRIRYFKNTGSPTYQTFGSSVNSGKFRLTRDASNDIEAYHDIGSGWVNQYPGYLPNLEGTAQIRLMLSNGESNPTARFEWDNLIDNLA